MHQTANILLKPNPPVPIAIGNVFDKGYRYGFNGKEIDKGSECMGCGGSTYDYGFRIYNPSLGKFSSVYPFYKSYPWFTPYLFAGNGPILNIDVDGNKIQVKENSVKSFEFNGTVYEAQFDKQTGNFAKYLGSDGNVIDYSIDKTGKSHPDYNPNYRDKTIEELEKLAKDGNRVAKTMKKLVQDGKRIKENMKDVGRAGK